MEPVIATPNNRHKNASDGLSLRWTSRLPLTTRILAVNIITIALLAGSLFYLDNYRDRLTEERLNQAQLQMKIMADALDNRTPEERIKLVNRFATHLNGRIRIYGEAGDKTLDSFEMAEPAYELIDPDSQPWRKDIARMLDRTIEFLVLSRPIVNFSEPKVDVVSAWPELTSSRQPLKPVSAVRYAPERTPVIIAATTMPSGDEKMLLTSNARDITRIVRAERSSVVLVIFLAGIVSILLSLFLARTIVKPIRKLARAAVRVRLGREPEIAIPRMPDRRDEIGQLARALADMSGALRRRIDSTDAFAADVSHEIKNPLASLRSALEGLERVKEPELQKQLLDVACDDVLRIDRLINDISEASRIDAELARSKFEIVDIGQMLDQLLAARERRDTQAGVKIAFARPGRGVATVMGDDGQLERLFNNILDNAVSFSPKGGLIEILATHDDDDIIIHICDEGPGVPVEQREKIFTRFHSDRPDGEAFGKHSGTGIGDL